MNRRELLTVLKVLWLFLAANFWFFANTLLLSAQYLLLMLNLIAIVSKVSIEA